MKPIKPDYAVIVENQYKLNAIREFTQAERLAQMTAPRSPRLMPLHRMMTFMSAVSPTMKRRAPMTATQQMRALTNEG
ncbi:MAG: hypothetical protein SF029_15255 [bacterium]|nr:hypothetical protein [bacterium]